MGSKTDSATPPATKADGAFSSAGNSDDSGHAWMAVAEMLGYGENNWALEYEGVEDGSEKNSNEGVQKAEAERQQVGESALKNCGSNVQSSGD